MGCIFTNSSGFKYFKAFLLFAWSISMSLKCLLFYETIAVGRRVILIHSFLNFDWWWLCIDSLVTIVKFIYFTYWVHSNSKMASFVSRYHGSVSENYMISKKIVFNHSNNVNTTLRIFQTIIVSLKVARIAHKYFLLQQHCITLRKKI